MRKKKEKDTQQRVGGRDHWGYRYEILRERNRKKGNGQSFFPLMEKGRRGRKKRRSRDSWETVPIRPQVLPKRTLLSRKVVEERRERITGTILLSLICGTKNGKY